jgi:membrane fusion protein, heavy metal efflux system
VAGEVVEPSKPLIVVADTSRMWVMADVSLADARRVAVGQPIAFRPDGTPDQAATGKVSWVSTAVDDQTRTVKVRAAHTFGTVHVTIREAPTAVAVPSEAVQWEGCCHVVFVRLTDDIFQTRKVRLGSQVNGFTEVLVGVLPGEIVAAAGSHVLKSEILKSALGAGCADGH